MSALRSPVLNRALSWPSGRRRRHRCRGTLSLSSPVGAVECRRRAVTLPALAPVVAAVDRSVAGHSHPLVDQSDVEPHAIKPSLQHLHRTACWANMGDVCANMGDIMPSASAPRLNPPLWNRAHYVDGVSNRTHRCGRRRRHAACSTITSNLICRCG
jgi:hypothetical protein